MPTERDLANKILFMQREAERRRQEREIAFADRRRITVAKVAALNGSINVPNRPGYVWVSTLGLAGSRYQAFNKGFTLLDGTPVMIAVAPQRPFAWEIIDLYTGDQTPQEGAAPSSFRLPLHAVNHQWPTEANPGKDPLTIYQPARDDLKAFVVSGLVVGVRPLIYSYNGQSIVFTGASNINLFAHVPTTPGTHRYVLVYLNLTSALPTALSGTAVSTTVVPTKPITPGYAIPSAYFLLEYGQLAVVWPDDYTDARPFITPEFFINSLTEQTDPTPNADYLVIYDGGLGAHRKVLLQNITAGGAVSSSGTLFTQLADSTVANTVTETTLTAFGGGSLTLPANLLQIGSVIRLSAAGHISDTGTPTMEHRVYLGGIELATTDPEPLSSNITEVGWRLVCNITCRTIGSSGTVVVSGWIRRGENNIGLVNTAEIAMDTTIALPLDFTAEWGTADAANTITCQEFIVEHLSGSGLDFNALVLESNDYLLLETGEHLTLE